LNGNPPLFFQGQVIACGGALVNAARGLDSSRMEEQLLGQGGLCQ